MKYRKTLAATALIGLMAITGCSRGAFPENNEANYNGERLVRSVTGRADGYNGYSGYDNTIRNTRGFTRGFTRNLNRSTTGTTRGTGRYTTDNARGLGQNRYTGTRTANNRNTRGLRTHTEGSRYGRRYENTGRMDHTFGYNNNNYGMELNRAHLNNRTHRTGNRLDNRVNSRIDNRLDGIGLNDSRTALDQATVPVIALEDSMEANSRVAEFFAARRNRASAANPSDPDTQPMPAPTQQPDTQPMPAPTQQPDTQPMPAPGTGNGTDTNEPDGTTNPVKVHPNAKRVKK
ncbi:MAG: hypothetical protein FWD90_00205 [Defluviitaleaceae bacterium]|nr:hypothetical protein [Defluviitaleaceae bacterium]